MTSRINDELRITKSALRFGPQRISRVQTVPPDTIGRNGDIVIVDSTTESIVDATIAIRHVPETVDLCQKIPLVITPGDFTIDDGTTVFTITITGLDDIVDAVNAANIPAFSAFVQLDVNNFRGPIIFRGSSVTIADGTSNFPSVAGIVGAFAGGDLEVPTGRWLCFPAGGIDLEFGGAPVAGGPFDILDFTGTGVTSIVDAGGGEATITISAGAAAGPAYGVIVGDVGTATATIASETITFGGIGVTVTSTDAGAGFDTVDFDLDISDLPAGVTVALTDEIGVDQAAAPNVRFTFTDVVEDLDIPFGITTNGLIIRTAADTYTSRSIVASTTAGLEGADIINGDGVAGNPEIGVDIDNLVSSVSNLGATDELIVFDGTNNLSYSGQQIADGATVLAGPNLWETIDADTGSTSANTRTDTLTIAGGTSITTSIAGDTVTIDSAFTISTINGQPVPTFSDSTRGPKQLSIETIALVWSDTSLAADEYLEFQEANNADAGFSPPHNATIVKASGVTEDNNGPGARDIDLFVNGALDTSGILTFTGAPSGQEEVRDVTLNIDVTAGNIVHLRGDSGANALADVAVVLFFKWRV